jgi:predicted DNA-binding transcriptional regulator YafY
MTPGLLDALCGQRTPPPPRPKGVPLTLWRAVRLWHALSHQPLTLQQSAQVLTDPKGPAQPATVSADTVQRTLNTLKAAGCQIHRPTASNGWTYQLGQHPLHRVWTLEEIDALLTIRQALGQRTNVTDVLTWDEGVIALLGEGLIQLTPTTPPSTLAIVAYFAQGRIVDYRPWRDMMSQLLIACQQHTLLRLRYQSAARKAPVDYAYLPLGLRFENGAPFVVGLSPKYPDMLSLRIDRLQAVDPLPSTDDPQAAAILADLLDRQHQPPVFELIVHGANPSTWQSWGLNETFEPLAPSPEHPSPRLRVTVATHEVFPLRQKVMALGLPLQVVRPDSFKATLREQFEAMAALYND